MFLNWGIEAKKWQISIKIITPISFIVMTSLLPFRPTIIWQKRMAFSWALSWCGVLIWKSNGNELPNMDTARLSSPTRKRPTVILTWKQAVGYWLKRWIGGNYPTITPTFILPNYWV